MKHSAASLLHPQRWTLSLCLTSCEAAIRENITSIRSSGKHLSYVRCLRLLLRFHEPLRVNERLSFDSLDEHPVLRDIDEKLNEIQTYNCANIHFYIKTLKRVWEAVWPLVKLLPLPRVPAEAVETIVPADVSYRLFKRLLDLTDKGSYFVLSAPWRSFEI